MGTPSRLSKKTIEAIAKGVENGLTLSGAAESCGIDRFTAIQWRDRGKEQKSGLFREFYEAIQRAYAKHENSLLDKMEQLALKGEKTSKVKQTTDKDGKIISTVREVTEKGETAASVRWLLEKRYGYDGVAEKAEEKAINHVLLLAKKYLDPEGFASLLEDLTNSKYSGISLKDELFS